MAVFEFFWILTWVFFWIWLEFWVFSHCAFEVFLFSICLNLFLYGICKESDVVPVIAKVWRYLTSVLWFKLIGQTMNMYWIVQLRQKIVVFENFPPTKLNWSWPFLSFFGIFAWVLVDFAWVLSFFELEFFSKRPKKTPDLKDCKTRDTETLGKSFSKENFLSPADRET